MIKKDCKNLWRLYNGKIACPANRRWGDKECEGCEDYFPQSKKRR